MDYTNWSANLVVVATTALAVVGAALTHYEGLAWLSGSLTHNRHPQRRLVLYTVLAMIGLHIIEIWIFGITYHLLLLWPETGIIHGTSTHNLLDHVYFSATVFTTIGFGDLAPSGPIRFLAGTEGLTGFVLVGWSASFTYLKMERVWKSRN